MLQHCFRYVVTAFLLLVVLQVQAQKIWGAEIGVNGLTCSQCSRSVEMQLRKLDFVQGVHINLEHTNGTIQFVTGKEIDFNRIARAVANAGFSVRYLRALVPANDLVAAGSNTSCYHAGPYNFQLIGAAFPAGKDTLHLQLLGSEFMPAAEYKHWKPLLVKRCGTAPAYFVKAN